MHPSVRSDHPGACPVCGMALVKKIVGESAATRATSVGDVILTSAQMVLANVATEPVKRQTLEKEITTVGVVSVAESRQATIAARFRGRVEKLYADYTGFVVRKGEPLFELYSPDITSATQDYILALNAGGAPSGTSSQAGEIPRDRLVSASKARLQTHFGMTEKQISSLGKSTVAPTTVRFDAPMSGTVLTKEVQEGEYVDEGTVLYRLAD
ncbi:MAG: efflux RND transporter periplasmic adaptor subunit, partial [Methanothrix sp.]|nr:efflux RND transporter periplasmic adaptor subunit [Methanothrix sp.]